MTKVYPQGVPRRFSPSYEPVPLPIVPDLPVID